MVFYSLFFSYASFLSWHVPNVHLMWIVVAAYKGACYNNAEYGKACEKNIVCMTGNTIHNLLFFCITSRVLSWDQSECIKDGSIFE
mmetsp:Transcript_17171/g.21810  ORF Transcript_17171/g.21810 Transcript_17171/m.21810 type:complete len:86 (+) Transcript_17171:615-872(+)